MIVIVNLKKHANMLTEGNPFEKTTVQDVEQDWPEKCFLTAVYVEQG